MPYDNTSYFLKLKVAGGMVHSLCSASLSSRTCLAGFLYWAAPTCLVLGGKGLGLVSLCAKQLL